jgi:hypothetical protein
MMTMMEWEARVITAVKPPTPVKRTLTGTDCFGACSDADTDGIMYSVVDNYPADANRLQKEYTQDGVGDAFCGKGKKSKNGKHSKNCKGKKGNEDSQSKIDYKKKGTKMTEDMKGKGGMKMTHGMQMM